MNRSIGNARISLAVILCTLPLIAPAIADSVQPGPTFTVTTTDAHNDGACTVDDCTLPEAVAAANASEDANTIIFQPGLTGGVVAPTQNGTFLDISNPLTIQGPAGNVIGIDGGGARRIFHVTSAGDVTISGLILRDGKTDASSFSPDGAGILHDGTGNLTLTDCKFFKNQSSNFGGAICHNSTGKLDVTNCSFGIPGNSAAYGGALFVAGSSGAVTLTKCYFASNSAPNGGGAINNAGTVSATNCTFTNNSAPGGGGGAVNMVGYTALSGCTFYLNTAKYGGGGLYSYTEAYSRKTILTNCTFTGNSSPTAGGAIYSVRGTTFLMNCTITGNTAPNAAGSGVATFIADNPDESGETDVANSIIAGNSNSDVDAVGATSHSYGCSSYGYNLIGSGSSVGAFTEPGSSDRTGLTTAQLHLDDGLKDNGGPTLTIALLAGSPAIDAGDNEDEPAPPDDQRGYPRVGASDIGAFEFGSSAPTPTPTATPTATSTPTATTTPSSTATPTPTPSSLGNISTRLRVETGDNVLIGGFIVTGTQQKKVLLRAIGPSLPVSGALADPLLELHDGAGSTIFSNNNWKDTQQGEIEATSVAPTNDLESAIVATLPANTSSYTAVIRGADGGTGVGLVEVFDLDSGADSTLANISTRGLVQTGDNVMIGGFIVLNGSKKVIVRAIGPSLPVAGALQDPLLELHDANGGITVNDNWRSDQEAEITATGVPPGNDSESAIVQTLPPGNYTAVVRGVNDTTGVALVEVFALN